jgi:hypothetical protein
MAYIMPLPGLPPATPAQLAGAAGGTSFQLLPARPSLTLPPAPRQAGGGAGGTPPALRRGAGPVAHRAVVLPVALRHLAAWLPRNGATGLVLVRPTPAPLPAPHSSATSPPPPVLVAPRQPAGVQPAVVPSPGSWRPMAGGKMTQVTGPAAAPAARRHGTWQDPPLPARPWDSPVPKATPPHPSAPSVSRHWLTQPSSHAAAGGRRWPRGASGAGVKAGLALAAGAAALLLVGGGQPAGEGEPAVPLQAFVPAVQPLGMPAAGLGSSGAAVVADAAAAEAGYTAWQVGRLSEALAGYQAEADLLRAEAAALVALMRRGGGSAPAPLAAPPLLGTAAASSSEAALAGPTAAGEAASQAGTGPRWGWLRGRRASGPLAQSSAAGVAPVSAGLSVAGRLEVVRGELSSLEVLCEALGAEIARTQRGDSPPLPAQV